MSNLPVLSPGSPLLHTWVAPGLNRKFTLRHGAVGFVVMHNVMRFNQQVERLSLDAGVDEGGYNHRVIAGTTKWSEHAKGGAVDLNWARHPSGSPVRYSFTRAQVATIHKNLHYYDDLITWGGDWPSHPGSHTPTDGMHFEFNGTVAEAEQWARAHLRTKWGVALLAANPGQKKVINS